MTATLPLDRRSAIQDLIRERTVHSQGELLSLLEERGFPCSQPALSRDLRALGVAKVAGSYQLVEEERVTPQTALPWLNLDHATIQFITLAK